MGTPEQRAGGNVVALSGGVGGAKLALGLSGVVPAQELAIIVNTGDDFEHLGLHVSPDLDTVMYVLAGLGDPERGWGRRDETWTFMRAAKALGAESWFQLGDGDLATHVERTRRLRKGERLSAVTANFCRRLGVAPVVLPMSDDPVRTVVETNDGALSFQHYFVRDRSKPLVRSFRFEGAETARPLSAALETLRRPGLRAVILCPSNPFVSIEPILAVPKLEDAIRQAEGPVVAVSPIVGGTALKGPAAKMMAELGMATTAVSVASYYAQRHPGLLSGFVAEEEDRDPDAETRLGMRFLWTKTVMRSDADKQRLASEVLAFARELRGDG